MKFKPHKWWDRKKRSEAALACKNERPEFRSFMNMNDFTADGWPPAVVSELFYRGVRITRPGKGKCHRCGCDIKTEYVDRQTCDGCLDKLAAMAAMQVELFNEISNC